ncbi:MAG: AzlC family ABC transporter permease [Evtepia sp.]
MKEKANAVSAAFPHTIPVLTGFIMIGMVYGVLMQAKGYGLLWSVLMSTIAFCGSMQFVAISLLTVVFNPLQAFLLSLMVNARHLFYGISMLEKYKGLGKARYFLIFTLCDETFSIVSSTEPPEDINPKYFFLAVSFLDYFYWILGTFIGGIVGHFMNLSPNGLDFVLTALFVVLFLEQIKKKENRISGLIGLVSTVIALFLFGADNLVIPAMLIILIVLLVGRKKL